MADLLLLALIIVGVLVLVIAVLALRQRQSLVTLALSIVALGVVLAAGLTSVVINLGETPTAATQGINYDGTPLE